MKYTQKVDMKKLQESIDSGTKEWEGDKDAEKYIRNLRDCDCCHCRSKGLF